MVCSGTTLFFSMLSSGSIQVRKSSSDGFITVFSSPSNQTNTSESPPIAYGNGTLYVGRTNNNLFYLHTSSDGGNTWNNPSFLDAIDSLASIYADIYNRVVVNFATQTKLGIFSSTLYYSVNGGQSFTKMIVTRFSVPIE